MKRATIRVLFTLLVCLPGAGFAQGRGKEQGNKPAQAHGQKQHTAKGVQQTQRTGKAKAQTGRTGQQKVDNRRVASQKIDRQQGPQKVEKRNASAKVQRAKTEVARGKVRHDVDRNVRVVNRSFEGKSGRERAAIVAISRGISNNAFVVTSTADRVRVKGRDHHRECER